MYLKNKYLSRKKMRYTPEKISDDEYTFAEYVERLNRVRTRKINPYLNRIWSWGICAILGKSYSAYKSQKRRSIKKEGHPVVWGIPLFLCRRSGDYYARTEDVIAAWADTTETGLIVPELLNRSSRRCAA